MKYFFILNPGSGKGKRHARINEDINRISREMGLDVSVVFTRSAGDGENIAREICQSHCTGNSSEKVRIYGCGGDGTLGEMVNGCEGYNNVEIGIIPTGTGNDYVRNYGKVSDFLDIKAQINGRAVHSDLIRYRAEYEGKTEERLCANMFNIGFDCNVVDLTARVKRLPFIGGSLAYLLSVFIILIKKKGADLRIEYENGSVSDGRILLIAIANGCFCGGGVKGVPFSILNDGLMDVSVINDMSRNLFVRLFPSYSKGTHMNKKQIINKNLIKYTKEKRLKITANGSHLRLCTDGEITSQKTVEFFMDKAGFDFIVPAGI